jgi:hypothetical protein
MGLPPFTAFWGPGFPVEDVWSLDFYSSDNRYIVALDCGDKDRREYWYKVLVEAEIHRLRLLHPRRVAELPPSWWALPP